MMENIKGGKTAHKIYENFSLRDYGNGLYLGKL